MARLLPCEVSCVDGIPVTSPARTLLDVATLLPFHDLEVAYADACARRLVRVREMTALLERARGRAGVAPLRRLVELDQADGLTRSEAERKLLTLVRTARLPAPSTNVRVGQSEVDCLWRSEKVVVEVDGYAFHSGKRAFERDRERDAGLVARGYVVLRITWAKLSERPASVIARGAAALAVRSES
ncbi:MAG: DUF559 domain-containing protein, partial [Longimicrobiales bacterium]